MTVTGTEYRVWADRQTKVKGQWEMAHATENPAAAGGCSTTSGGIRQVCADISLVPMLLILQLLPSCIEI